MKSSWNSWCDKSPYNKRTRCLYIIIFCNDLFFGWAGLGYQCFDSQMGEKLFLCLVVFANSALSHQPGRWSYCQLLSGGRGSSSEMLPAFFLTLNWYRSCVEGRFLPMVFFAVLLTQLQPAFVLFLWQSLTRQ